MGKALKVQRGGGPTENINGYRVCSKVFSIADGTSSYSQYLYYTNKSYTVYNAVSVNENGEIVLSDPFTFTTPSSLGKSADLPNLSGKYMNGDPVYKYASNWTWNSNKEAWGCTMQTVVVKTDITTVKYGVNDDPSLYATEVKCADGYYRSNITE